jgi:hypothetical protein
MKPAELALMLAVGLGPALAFYLLVDEKEIGRTDPKRAAFYSAPSSGFYEAYEEGPVLGFTVGMSKSAALGAIEASGFVIDTNSWGDNRAGGASLYTRSELDRQARSVSALSLESRKIPGTAVDLLFAGDRVVTILVSYD